MNYINCKNFLPPTLIRKTIAFWCKNSIEHINALISSPNGTTATLKSEFIERLQIIKDIFENFLKEYSNSDNPLPSKPILLFKTNNEFIDLLERIKFEGFSGYPILQQSVFHYIYEQNYINAIFSVNNTSLYPLFTVKMSPFYNNVLVCAFKQMYFWSIIGAMHPSLLLNSNEFYNSINGYSKEFLTEITNGFNGICFTLSQMRKPNKKELSKILNNFRQLNETFLNFLNLAVNNSPQVFQGVSKPVLSKNFYQKSGHIIEEHTLVSELISDIQKALGI